MALYTLHSNNELQQGYVEHRDQLKTRELPKIAYFKSYKVPLKQGETYFYCTCGLSKAQPFCDGSHKDKKGFKPLKFTHTDEDKVVGLCGCKLNQNHKGPFCDGSHKTLNFEKLAKDTQVLVIPPQKPSNV
ncbi:hypothetical protein FGO68_gene16150 [Halteria grandinella]|uniref:Iron-binding zinc finger CDGSH type domain-containing protein n=1 Tax=Halteria grandinella TaxID=5974 RepID=A0A8J8T1N6_HALGN|nr:hypothetical protein FGO68_gene16150 [Halteria grandinella]